MFQPGEEGYHGARFMLEEGLHDGGTAPSAAFALHGGARYPAGVVGTRPGPILASGDTIEAVIHGRGGHASAPHDCLDPIPIACEIVQALQTFVTRRVDAFDPAVITIAKIEAGSTRNVIPETARMLGTIRTVSERTRERVLDGVDHLIKGLAAAHGAQAEVKLIRGYPVTVNDEGITGFASHVAAELLGEDARALDADADDGQRRFLVRAPPTAGDPDVPRHAAGWRCAGHPQSFEPHGRQREGHGHRRRAPRGDRPAIPRRHAQRSSRVGRRRTRQRRAGGLAGRPVR